MDDPFTLRVRAAARAGWWMLLIGAIVVTVQWLAFLCVMSRRPAWVLDAWFGGADISWDTLALIWLWMTGVLKLILWLLALVVIWLTLWGRRLRKM